MVYFKDLSRCNETNFQFHSSHVFEKSLKSGELFLQVSTVLFCVVVNKKRRQVRLQIVFCMNEVLNTFNELFGFWMKIKIQKEVD